MQTDSSTLPTRRPNATPHDLLNAQLVHHEREVHRLSAQLADVDEPVGDEPGAQAAHLMSTTRLLDTERLILTEIEAALTRLADGTYGRCEECTKQIADERLLVLPRARLCVHCQARHATR